MFYFFLFIVLLIASFLGYLAYKRQLLENLKSFDFLKNIILPFLVLVVLIWYQSSPDTQFGLSGRWSAADIYFDFEAADYKKTFLKPSVGSVDFGEKTISHVIFPLTSNSSLFDSRKDKFYAFEKSTGLIRFFEKDGAQYETCNFYMLLPDKNSENQECFKLYLRENGISGANFYDEDIKAAILSSSTSLMLLCKN